MTVVILLRRALARPGQNEEDEVLGPCERGALVAGLRLATGLGRDAIAIAVGPARREDRVLAMALRAGCARAVRLGADGLDDLDYLGVAEALAAAIRKVGSDLILCGDRSLDERVGAIGPAVAELLGYAHVTGVGSATAEGKVVLCERQGDRDRLRLKVTLPAVLCMRPPRIGSERDPELVAAGSGRARTSPQGIDALEPDEVGLDLRRLASRKAIAGRLRATRGGRHATILGSPAELIERLTADRLLAGDRGGGREGTS